MVLPEMLDDCLIRCFAVCFVECFSFSNIELSVGVVRRGASRFLSDLS